MLRIYPVVLDWLKVLRPLIAQIARHDRELAKQLRGSSSSVVLNLGEGMYSRGGHRTNAYGVALREMGESYSALQAAQVHGYIGVLEPGFEAQCQRILGTLVKAGAPGAVSSGARRRRAVRRLCGAARLLRGPSSDSVEVLPGEGGRHRSVSRERLGRGRA